MSGAGAISLRDVWKEHDGQAVLERVALEIAPRPFVAVVGPSGCGKTTLLRTLMSEERPSRGRILLNNEPLAPEPAADRGAVFQRYSVFPHLTVLANVILGRELASARLFGQARRRVMDEARALLQEVGRTGAANACPAQLSGGMQQRLAQALFRRPKTLLPDEPFGALDPGIRADIHGA